MASSTKKQVIELVKQFFIVAVITSIFVALFKLGYLKDDTQVPSSIKEVLQRRCTIENFIGVVVAILFGHLDSIISVREILATTVTLVSFVLIYKLLKGKTPYLSWLRIGIFSLLTSLTGAFYSLGALFFAVGIVSPYVSYFREIEEPYKFGLMCSLLGAVIWMLAREAIDLFLRGK